MFSKKSKSFVQVISYLAQVSSRSIPRTKITGSKGKTQFYFCTFSCYCLILFYRNCAILHWEGFLKGFCKCSNLTYNIVGTLRHSSKSEVVEWTYTLFLLDVELVRVPWFLLFFFFFFYEDIMICEWKIKSSPRENMCIKKTKVKTQLKSLSLGSLSCLPQAAWVPSPLNFTSTFSDSDLFPRPKFLTPGWTNTNVLRITELNVWYAGCLINLSRIIILCRVVSACPKAYSLGRLRDTNKGYMGKSLWIG